MLINVFWRDIIIKPRSNYADDVAKYLGDHITKYQAIILTFSVRQPSPMSPIFVHSTPTVLVLEAQCERLGIFWVHKYLF